MKHLLTVLLLLLFPALLNAQGMIIRNGVVSSGGTGSWSWHAENSSTAQSGSFAVTIGDLIVVFSTTTSGNTDSSVTYTDNAAGGSNTYTRVDCLTTDRPQSLCVGWAIAKATESISITPSNGGIIDFTYGASFSHSGGTIPGTNVHNKAISALTVDVTTTATNSLLVGWVDCSTSITVGSGFTVIFAAQANTVRVSAERQTTMTNTIGANTVNYTCGGTAHGIIAVGFNPP